MNAARQTLTRRSAGQALVEFALVFPLFLVLFIGIVEFAFLFNASLSTTFATRDASLVAAEAGNASGADCVILQMIEQDISAPADDTLIAQVDIYWWDPSTGAAMVNGGATRVDTYTRTSSTNCTVNGATVTVPYLKSGTLAYKSSDRCNILSGCGVDSLGVNHAYPDTVGVKVTYAYPWHTPLKTLLGFTGGGWTLTPSNSMRMEPVL
jgi:Flp pilus assembly protein TadG